MLRTQKLWQKLMTQALDLLRQEGDVVEYFPPSLLQKHHLPDLKSTLLYVHCPPPEVSVADLLAGKHPAQQRLALEELVAHQLSRYQLRQMARRQQAIALASNGRLAQRLIKNLPFQLTAAQQRVQQEIQQDLAQPQPMLRLLQGDVGSGKTLVAALSLLPTVENNYQAAFMVPTELLARQHAQTLSAWFKPLGISVGLLTGKLSQKSRKQCLSDIVKGKYQVIIGTHALFQKDVHFARLAYIIIDEQHRFGVHQRLSLQTKGVQQGFYPHQLIMTATPIPRTLAMTAYAELDYSVIDELPLGRQPIKTALISDQRRLSVIDRLQQACAQKRQAYWVCTLIEESEVLQAQAAEKSAQQLRLALPELQIGLIHSRIAEDEKQATMSAFMQGDIDVLVATTVVEVGVDVTNASLIIIENPERLGLAQLHQLRGRVGRGSIASHCVLLYRSPLSQLARQRLEVMRSTQDGFVIAQRDLEIRGPGELLGTRQAGLLRLRIADLLRDQALLPLVKQINQTMLEEYPHCVEALIERWLAGAQQYAQI